MLIWRIGERLYEKTAIVIRDVAGRHLFQDANKQTVQSIAEQMMKANGGTATPAQIQSVIDQVGQGGLRPVEKNLGKLAQCQLKLTL